MPQVFALVIAGAGLYAGYKWLARTLADVQNAGQSQNARGSRGGAVEKDLGTLELDAKTGVYSPRRKV